MKDSWLALIVSLYHNHNAASDDEAGPFHMKTGSNPMGYREPRSEILTADQMGEADRLTIEGGVPGYQLMEAAGQAVADGAMQLLEDRSGSGASGMVCILCGPGNNGGDGFVAARLLEEEGWSVILGCSVDLEDLRGDARQAAEDWGDEIYPLSSKLWQDADLVIDALFGAGLDRPLGGEFASLIDELNQSGLPVLAVDLPSGVEGSCGHVRGAAVRADRTVTFFRFKPGHLLLPGKALCGPVACIDIGIEDDVLVDTGFCGLRNDPALWLSSWPEALKPLDAIVADRLGDHKFHRGHCLVLCGDTAQTGAARLSARAALRSGAGLVTLAPPPEAVPVVASHLTSIMIAPVSDVASLRTVVTRRSYDVIIAGPALGVDPEKRNLLYHSLEQDVGLVLDADALTIMSEDIEHGDFDFEGLSRSPAALSQRLILTPHEGEFARLFPDLSYRMREDNRQSKIDCARLASQRSGATIILKGADSVIANREGVAVVHSDGVPYLATAGSGDVLAGLAGGLLAQGMPAMEAACAAVWLHCEAGKLAGAGLIAEDLPDLMPQLFAKIWQRQEMSGNKELWLEAD